MCIRDRGEIIEGGFYSETDTDPVVIFAFYEIKNKELVEKQIEVIKAFYHTDEETIYLESCMFKIKSELLFEERQIQNIIKESDARIVTVNRDFFVLEKSGRRHEIEMLHRELSAFGIMQFVRSGRIAVTKDEMKITEMLAAFNNYSNKKNGKLF